MKRTWRRRNFFIKKELQGKYIFSFFIFTIGGSIIFTLIFSLLSANTLTVIYDNYNLRIGKTPLILLKEILSAHWIFIVTAGIFIVVISMFLTHRFAGPMFRFEKSVEEMVKGNFDFQIRLREKDEGKELAELMNRLITMFSSNVREMRRLTDEIASRLTIVSGKIRQIQPEEAAIKLDEASILAKKLRDMFDFFKTKDDA